MFTEGASGNYSEKLSSAGHKSLVTLLEGDDSNISLNSSSTTYNAYEYTRPPPPLPPFPPFIY